MFRLCLFALLATTARAGLIGGIGIGHGVVAAAPVAVAAHVAPVAVAAPAIAVAHGATSYQNSNSISLNPTAVVTKVAAPVAVAAPVFTKVAAPVAVAPVGLGLGFGKGLAYGLH
ncbi:cuticle protein 63-like [Anoplophora glabripennis]|uniref:cuticle protein 63-like n=1 Tax=Anoplophora glabripennis TaxID=217634 RepID=UPI000874E3A1|nr:cuticle protein 63-like [Anoplophora glabripennis]